MAAALVINNTIAKDRDHVERGEYPGQNAAGHPLRDQRAGVVLNGGHDLASSTAA
jgi:hypothetical protein